MNNTMHLINTKQRNAFETWCRTDSPKWPTERDATGDYLNPLTQRFWREWVRFSPECQHGTVGLCMLCEAESAPKCTAHNNPWYCGHCGPVNLARH